MHNRYGEADSNVSNRHTSSLATNSGTTETVDVLCKNIFILKKKLKVDFHLVRKGAEEAMPQELCLKDNNNNATNDKALESVRMPNTPDKCSKEIKKMLMQKYKVFSSTFS